MTELGHVKHRTADGPGRTLSTPAGNSATTVAPRTRRKRAHRIWCPGHDSSDVVPLEEALQLLVGPVANGPVHQPTVRQSQLHVVDRNVRGQPAQERPLRQLREQCRPPAPTARIGVVFPQNPPFGRTSLPNRSDHVFADRPQADFQWLDCPPARQIQAEIEPSQPEPQPDQPDRAEARGGANPARDGREGIGTREGQAPDGNGRGPLAAELTGHRPEPPRPAGQDEEGRTDREQPGPDPGAPGHQKQSETPESRHDQVHRVGRQKGFPLVQAGRPGGARGIGPAVWDVHPDVHAPVVQPECIDAEPDGIRGHQAQVPREPNTPEGPALVEQPREARGRP